MKKIAVLFSSGVESSSLLAKYLNESYKVYPIYIEGGFKYEADEKVWAKNLWSYFKNKFPEQLMEINYLNLNWDYGRSDAIPLKKEQLIIPLRNLVMFSMAAIYMSKNSIEQIASGIMGDEGFPDTSLDYLNRLERLISEGASMNFDIIVPFHGMTKADVIKDHYNIVPFEMTRSCTSMIDSKHCGKCSKCVARKLAFKDSGCKDPSSYLEELAA